MTLPDQESWVDIHNHLVPGVDDGARDLGAVLDSVERLTRLGIRRILTTPHIRGSLTLDRPAYQARLDEVTQAFERATEAIGARFPEVEFVRGHEVLIDIPEVDLSDPRIRMGGTSFVLIEWPMLQIPPGTVRVISQIREQGYRPIVAHPERYAGLLKSFDLAARWRAMGAALQVNHGSLVGRYGSEAKELALRLLREGWVDYMASDFHGGSRLKIYKSEAEDEMEERRAGGAFEILCRTNPSRHLADEEPLPVPCLPPDPPFFARLGRMLKREGA